MHKKNIIPKVLCLIGNELYNSLTELKDYLNFSLLICDDLLNNSAHLEYEAILIEAKSLNSETKKFIKLNNHKPKLVMCYANFKNIDYNEIISFPINLIELNDKIQKIITSKQFVQNSSLNIKNYILDKNEKIIKKNDLFVTLTEKEIQLIELLFNNNKPIKKKDILAFIWKYSADADTHTVETHIYRLRKKLNEKFNDDSFIINKKDGYII